MDYKLSNDINYSLSKFKNSIASLKDSAVLVEKVIELLEGDTWISESKKSLLSILLLSSEFHKKLLDVLRDNFTVVNELVNNSDEFMDTCPIIKNLED
jgi:hypothetical protein